MVALVYSPVQVPLSSVTPTTSKPTQPPVMRPIDPNTGGSTGNSFQDFMQQLAGWSGGGQFGSQLQSWLQQMPQQSAGQTLDAYRQSVMDWRHAMPGMSAGGSSTQPAYYTQQPQQQPYQAGNGFNAAPSANDQQFYQSHGFYPGG